MFSAGLPGFVRVSTCDVVVMAHDACVASVHLQEALQHHDDWVSGLSSNVRIYSADSSSSRSLRSEKSLVTDCKCFWNII